MTENNSDSQIQQPKKLSRRQFLAGAGAAGVALAIGYRGNIAETVFSRDEGDLIGPELAQKFPREKLKFPMGDIAVRDLRPDALREDEDIPMVSMMGLGMDQKVLSVVNEALYNQGEHAILLDCVGGEGAFGTFSGDEEMKRQGDLLAEFVQKYSSDHPEIEQFDLLGQSLSSISILNFVKNHPDLLSRIRNIIFVSPVGLVEKDSMRGVIRRQLAEVNRSNKSEKSEYQEKADKVVVKTFLSNLISHPVRSLEELSAIAKANNYPTVESLIDHGINVGMIQGSEDLLADPYELQKRMGKGFPKTVVELTEEERESARREIENLPEEKSQQVKEGLARMGLDAPVYKHSPMSEAEQERQKKTPVVTLRIGGHEVMAQEAIVGTIIRMKDRFKATNSPGRVTEYIR